jgi:hypothetical protein
LCERLARFSEPPKRKKNPAVKCSRGEVPSGHVPHPSRRGMTMDRGGPTRRAAGRVAGGADPKRVGPCPRGVRAHRGRVARGGRVARRGVRARAGANARNPNDPRIFARCPRVLRKKNHRSIGSRTHLRSRCPPAEPSKRRASRCPASRTEPVPREGRKGEIKTSDGQLEVLRRPRTRVGNETIGNTVSLAENRDATPSVSSGRCRAPRRRRDRGKSSMGSFDVP